MRQYWGCRARPHEQPWSHVRSHYLLGATTLSRRNGKSKGRGRICRAVSAEDMVSSRDFLPCQSAARRIRLKTRRRPCMLDWVHKK